MMTNWTQALKSAEVVGRINRRLAAGLAQCPPFEQAGWTLHCVQCHVGTGTYAAGFQASWHLHQEYQLEIGLSGRIQFQTRTQKFTLRPGGVVAIPWKHPHCWTCEQAGPMLGVALVVVPTVESIRANGNLFTEAGMRRPPAVKALVNQLLEDAMNPAEPAFGGRREAARIFLLLAEILQTLLPKPSGAIATTTSEIRGREMAAWAVHYVEENLEKNIQATTLARELKMSARQLHRLFVKYIGQSLREFLAERRMERARVLLATPDHEMQIKEIAFLCGFKSLAYFSNTFRQTHGVSPSDLRFKPVEIKSRVTSKFVRDPSR